MTKEKAIEILNNLIVFDNYNDEAVKMAIEALGNSWIPVTEGLPKNTEPVNITWVNRKPEPYYADIKDKPFAATGHYCNGRWWWYSAVCQDYLDEYGKCDMDEMDGDIEVIAWQPLPEPYEGESGGRVAESAQNVPNDELISKKAAIDAEPYKVEEE